ncbi:MAG: TOMM precursor leader peptide-binding protein [Gemmatimonadales bacterium]|nr:TOMM precursor leader peptide-binding protein [Gemmatimonadales bacterium]
MLSRPRFRASLEVVPVGSRLLFLLDEHRQVVLEGHIYPRLAPLLDGLNSVADIAEKAGDQLSLHETLFAVAELERRGYLIESAGSPGPDAAFREYFAPPAGRPAAALGTVRVAVRSVGGVPPHPMRDLLDANGLVVDDAGDFLVVVTDDYLRPELETLNREALEAVHPWMLVKPGGMIPWVGPIFVPGRTGCWCCLAQRLRANRQMERYILDRRESAEPLITARAWLPASVELGLNLAATEIVKWILTAQPGNLEGSMVTLDLLTNETRLHTLTKRPQCRRCGDRSLCQNVAATPITLSSQIKRFRSDGGHRILTPQETFDRYKHHVSPVLGAVTDLRPALGSHHRLTHNYVAGHNFSMGVESVVFLRESVRGMSGGKGTTEIQAKVSGLCEAIERYCGVYWGEEHSIRGAYDRMKPEAIHPNECMGFSDAQYRARARWNASQPKSRCVLIPRPFDPKLEVEWSPLWSLTNQEYRYLPSAYCYYGHPEFSARWCSPDSNGCAAGNTPEEAILQGFMELVERDHVALWWYNRVRRRGVDLASFGLPYLDQIVDHYAEIQRDIWILDITGDLGISTFACISRRTDRPHEDILLGFGAHFDPKVAILRSITEVNQFLPSVALANRDGSTHYLFADELARDWWMRARIEDLDYLVPDPKVSPARLADFDDPSSDDLLADIQIGIERARQHGLEVLVLDQTRPDIGLAVVKVVVPGLCHFWRRLGPRRLYEVPVKMGWLDNPLEEDQLNPFTVFF